MKRFLVVWFLILGLLIAPITSAFAYQYVCASMSGKKTESALVHTGKCAITAVTVITDGSNDITVELYDNTAASGTLGWEITVPAADQYGGRTWDFPILFNTGLYCKITTSGTAKVYVEYIER